jgi:endo-1,4-beta-mannosidase
MRLLEDYWQSDWPTVAADFAEMKRLGANVVRIHLQFAKFMTSPDKPNPASLAQLKRLLDLAQSTGLYLDITGLACYRRADVPAWYIDLDERNRWQAQANFWQAIASTCADHPAVFCYDLINEPAVPAEARKAKDWLTGDLGGFTYCQFIALDAAGRDRTQIASQWSAMMTAAIRKYDRQTLITVGLLPFYQGTGFDPAAQAKVLDFIAVHYYPDKSDLDAQVKFLRHFAVGKPLVVEEIFPMKADPESVGDFMQKSNFVAGWLSFYWGESIEQLKKSGTIKDALIIEWLKFFEKNAARMKVDARPNSP